MRSSLVVIHFRVDNPSLTLRSTIEPEQHNNHGAWLLPAGKKKRYHNIANFFSDEHANRTLVQEHGDITLSA